MITTVSDAEGNVCTYIERDGKHTLTTFDAETNHAYVETLVKLADFEIWAYMVADSRGVYNLTWGTAHAEAAIKSWQDTREYLRQLHEEF